MKFLASLCTLSRLAGAQSRGQGSPAGRAAQARSGPGATATAMLSKASTLRKVLWELLSMLEERPLRKPFLTTRDSTRVLALAATRALCELLQQCSRSQEVKAFFSRLCLALLFQIAFTAELTPQDLAVFRRQCHRWDPCTPTSPVSSAVQTLESLFCCAGYEHQALLIRQQGGWHMLLSAEALHLGVIVVARELRKSPAPEQRWMLNQLVALLEREDEFREIPAMAFFSEVGLMTGGASCHLPALVPVLCSQLLVQGRRRRGCRGSRGQRSRWAGVPWGTGKGLRGPAGSLWSQLPAGGVLCGLAGLAQSCQWAPARRQGAGSAAGLVRLSVPCVFQLSRGRASRETLLQAAQLLQWEQLRHLAKTGQTGKISECMLARYRSRAEDYVGQSLPFLQDPQASLREAAVRFIALQPLQNDSHPCVSALATQTILMLRPPQENSPSAFSLRALRSRLRRSWVMWHVLLGCCSVGAELEQQC
nr:PREDICTED: uncharacterized protein LOC104148645 [Struthio camelus australis]